MATLEDKHVTTAFQGLASQAYVALGIAGVGITVFESLRRLKRPTRNVRNKKRDAQLNSEDWSFNGYLYQARAFSPYRPVKLHSIWPFFWVWQILRTRTSDIALRSGVDSAAYVCVLQGIWIFCVFLLLTVFPALFTIHLKHSPQWYAADDLNRASLSALVSDSDNVRLLWVHVLFLWFMTIGFWIIIIYVGRQILNLRRLVLQDVIKNGGQIVQRHPEHRGWRHRTLLVSNIPVGMRSKKELQTYFRSLLAGELVLKRDLKTLTGQAWRGRKKHNDRHQQDEESTTPVEKPQVEAQDEEAQGYPPPPPVASTAPTVPQDDVVSNIVLVKRTLLVHEVFRKREDALHELEKAHIQLAKNLLARVKTHLELQTQRSRDSEKANPDDAQMDQLARQLQPFLDPSKEKDKSIWEVLADMPRDLLDPFQATRREEILFNGQKVPLIDYWLTYFNFLDERLQLFRAKACDDEIDAPAFATASKTETGGKEEEDRELKEFNPKPTPTAFVTLESAAAARLLIQKYPNHPERPWACTLEEAPDSRDLVWNKLAASSFRGDVLRSFIVQVLVWAFIIIWVLPVSLILSLVSLNNLAGVFKPLERYLATHEDQKSLLSSLVPTVLLSILLFLVPTLLIQLSERAQHFVTVSKLHHTVLCRYHAFLLFDVIIVFCAGRTALESLFTEPGKLLAADSLLHRIASAFPAGAAFFIGWQILVTGVHPFFELMLLGFPWINHFGVAKAGSHRKRMQLALPRSVNIYSLLPIHLLVLSILHIFALLNPLVIPFGFVYWSVTVVVFKRSFATYYWRRHYDLNGHLIFVRFMRYALDGLLLAQIVIIALLWVSKFASGGAACIPPFILTVFFKLVGTRAFNALSTVLDIEEADTLAEGPNTQTQQIESVQIPIAPAFLGKTWPFSKAVVTIAVDRNKREKERHEAIERAQEREKQPGHRPVPVRSFSAAPRITVDPEATPILQRSASEIEDSEDSHTSAGSPIKRRMTPLQLPTLVLPRAPVERDDRADPSCQYDNPFLNSPLEYHLWLPRDPLLPIDLSDSVEYRGSALVSSAGGLGRLGSKHTAPQVTELVESPIEEPLEETEVLGDDSASIQSADRSEHRRPLSAIFVTPKRRSRSNTIHSKSPASTRTSPSRFSGFEQIETAQHLGEAVSSHGPHVTFSRRDTLSPQSFETDSGLHSSQPSGIPPPTSASTSSREQVGKASYPPTNDRGRLSASALSGLSRQPSHISGTVSQADALREAVREEYRQESQSKKTRKRRNTHGEADDKREEANERAADRSWLQSRLQTSRTTAVPSVDVVQTLDGGAT